MKVLIVGSSKLPTPAVKGGAVPNLIEQLIRQNEKNKDLNLFCCSLYDPEAEREAKKYRETSFIWAKKPKIVKSLDQVTNFIFSKLLHFKKLHSLSYVFQIAWLSWFVAGVLKKGNYDAVVFENSVPLLYALKLWGNKKKYIDKYYLHMHSVPRRYYGNAKTIRNGKGLICISQYVANEMLKDRRLKINPEKIQIMYNCIDTEIFTADNMQTVNVRQKHQIEKEKKILMFAGRLCKEKGIVELLQAVRLMDREDILLLVVGSNFYKSGIVSVYESYLQSLVEDISEKVKFTGYVDYEQIADYYKSADVVVLPSMWEEPAGMTMLEAMACARPLVTTISGGIPEYAGQGNCIMLHRDESLVQNMAVCINELLENRILAETIALKAAERASHFSMGFYYDQFLQILKGKES